MSIRARDTTSVTQTSGADLLAPGCRLVASIGGTQPEALDRRMRGVDTRADLLELRLDRVPRDQVTGLVSASPLPVIATCRRGADGGLFEGDEVERAARLRAAARAGASWVDVEWGSDLARSAEAFAPARVILSWHDYSGTPPDLGEKLRAMRGVGGATWIKLVTTARGLGDLAPLRELLRSGSEGGSRNGDLIAFAMGATGAASRLLAPAWGSRATYASGADEATAPGQIPVPDMLELYRLRRVGSATRIAGLLGRPLGHSLSPRLHNAAYDSLGLDWIYVPFESESVEALRAFLDDLGIDGVSVTIPHKEACLAHLDEIEPLAREVGAVNTIVRRGGKLHGYNTDAEAAIAPLRAAFAPAVGGEPRASRPEEGRRDAAPLAGKRVALLGAGGAARTLAFTLRREGCRVRVFNRTPERARRLADAAGVEWGPWNALEQEPYEVLVQATSVGMHPRIEESPLPEAWLRGSLVYDIVYNPPETALLKAARRRGIRVLDGTEMFLGQAAAQFRLFTGSEPPLEAWRAVLAAALDGRRFSLQGGASA